MNMEKSGIYIEQQKYKIWVKFLHKICKTTLKIRVNFGKKSTEKKSPKKVSKKSLQKKVPLERFFSEKFFEIWGFSRCPFHEIRKKFWKKIVLRVPFFQCFFFEKNRNKNTILLPFTGCIYIASKFGKNKN